jgi:hypothetical protein
VTGFKFGRIKKNIILRIPKSMLIFSLAAVVVKKLAMGMLHPVNS